MNLVHPFFIGLIIKDELQECSRLFDNIGLFMNGKYCSSVCFTLYKKDALNIKGYSTSLWGK